MRQACHYRLSCFCLSSALLATFAAGSALAQPAPQPETETPPPAGGDAPLTLTPAQPAPAPAQPPPAAQPVQPAPAQPAPAPAQPPPAAQPVQPSEPLAPEATPPPAAPPPAPADQGDVPDHDRVVGRVGIGYLGLATIPLASASPGGSSTTPQLTPDDPFVRDVPLPMVGARIWFSQLVGLDLALGFRTWGGEGSQASAGFSVSVAKESVGAGMLGAGVPLALANEGVLSLQINPVAAVGYSRATRQYVPAPGQVDIPPDATLSGFEFDIGMRAGAELHFGFLGAPRLAVEGMVGAWLSFRSATATAGTAEFSDSTTEFSTVHFNDPWDIFQDTVSLAARYYF